MNHFRFSARDHWLTFNNESKIVGCHCGKLADDWDEGYGDSILDHIAFEAALETLRTIGYPEDSPITPVEVANIVAFMEQK